MENNITDKAVSTDHPFSIKRVFNAKRSVISIIVPDERYPINRIGRKISLAGRASKKAIRIIPSIPRN